jgi:hypothetical protein
MLNKSKELNNMKIENMTSVNGNKVPNQFIINNNGEEYFQSYNSIIAKKSKGKIYLDDYFWDYSVTTGKYRNDFLGEGIAETRKKITTGEYILTNLNEKGVQG